MKLPTKKKPIETDLRKFKFLIYGQPGAGKSTFASKFPDAIFIPTEPGLNFLECHTLENDDGEPMVCRSWTDVQKAIKLIVGNDHQFKTVVIDTIDNAFEFCAQAFNVKMGLDYEGDADYGKGWKLLEREFKKTFNYLANSGFGLVFISHEKIGQKEERGIKRMWIDNTLGTSARKYVNGLVDFIFYAYLDDDEKRLIRTRSSLNIMAKDRTGTLPEVMPLDFNLLKQHLNKGEK